MTKRTIVLLPRTKVLVYVIPLCILAAALGGDGEDWFVGAMLGLGSYAACLWLIVFWRS